MSQFDTNSYTTTGEKTIVTTKDDGLTEIAIQAPNSAVYNVEFTFDNSSGVRHFLLSLTGNFNGIIPLKVNGVGLNVTTIPSGTIIFEVLSELELGAI